MDNPAAPIPLISPQPAVQPGVSSPVESPNRRWLLWLIGGLAVLVFGIALGVFAAKFLNQSQNQSQLPSILTPAPSPQSPTPTPTPDLTANWKTYSNRVHIFTFKYPQGWFGPEEYQNYYIEVGTSKPHKYGEDQTYDLPTKDSYFVTVIVNYKEDVSPSEWEKQPWMADINSSINLAMGESISSHGVRRTKVKDFTVGGLPAFELLTDNDPQGTGTEFVYMREIIIKSSDLVIRIQGNATIISAKSAAERVNKARFLDRQYTQTFDQILSTFHFLK